MGICPGNLPGAIMSDEFREVFQLLGQAEAADVARHGQRRANVRIP